MVSIRRRLERGERCWPAELALRSTGLGLIYLCTVLARGLCRLVGAPPPHPGSPLEFLVGAALWVSLSVGLALSFEGPGLLRILPMPPRAMLP